MDLIYKYQDEQGWSDTTLLHLLIEYLRRQQNDPAAIDEYLRDAAIAEAEMVEEDDEQS